MAKTTRLIQNFGANTEHAVDVGRLLNGCSFVCIPFAGGVTEIPHIAAKQLIVNDLHRHVINLCRVVADDESRKRLAESADKLPYHPDVLAQAQGNALEWLDRRIVPRVIPGETWTGNAELFHYAALAYFVCVWMGRGGKALASGEFRGELPVRWNANGGGSNRRYRTAIEGLEAWGQTFKRCEFVCMDALDVIDTFAKRSDKIGHGIFADPPWPDAGEEYRHQFDQHEAMRDKLASLTSATVVVRYGDHPMIRDLYAGWDVLELDSRDQANQRKPELLIHRRAAT